mgnify:CR=1 FL=1
MLFGIIIWFRNKLYDLKLCQSKEFDIPVISVGNITVGGTGKTPTTEYIIRLLKSEYVVATLSRGYKRKTKGFVLATEASTSKQIGDEPKQIKQKFPDICVAVCENRVKGINKIQKVQSNVNIILLDDAFQHRRVIPGISVLLIDYHRPISKDSMLPRGSLRESPYQMKRANIILVTKCPIDMKPIEKRIIEKELHLFPYQTLYFTTIRYGKVRPVFEAVPDIDISKSNCLLVTGIANAKPLVEHVTSITKNTNHLIFPDHYSYLPKDQETIIMRYNQLPGDNKIILTTEKDAVRFRDFVNVNEILVEKMYYIPIEIEFMYNDSDNFNKQILNYVRSNKKYIGFHS